MGEKGWDWQADAEPAGGTGDYSSITEEGSNTFTGIVGAKIHGQYGYRSLFNTMTADNDACCGVWSSMATSGTVFIRYYIRFPSSFYPYNDLANPTLAYLVPLYTQDSGAVGIFYHYWLFNDAPTIQFNSAFYDGDNDDTMNDSITVTQGFSADTDIYIDTEWKASTGASDGVFGIWYDGNLVSRVTNHDNQADIDLVACGCVFGDDTNFVTNNDYYYTDDVVIGTTRPDVYNDFNKKAMHLNKQLQTGGGL